MSILRIRATVLAMAAVALSGPARGAAPPAEVPRFGLFEAALEHQGDHENPYWDVEAMAAITGPGGKTIAVDLFWDGERTWRFRFSPPVLGSWRWRTASKDPGLDSKSGEFSCVKSDLRGGIRPKKAHPFHFEREDGKPYWLFGDTNWSLFGADPAKNFTRASFEQYVKLRARQKFNFVEGILTSPPAGNEGGSLFVDDKQRSVNPDFFREVDKRMVTLNRQGLTAMIFLSWSNPQAYIFSWRHFADAEARRRYARYVIARYGAFNVCFGVTGEWNGEKHLLGEFEAIGRLLAERNPSLPGPAGTGVRQR